MLTPSVTYVSMLIAALLTAVVIGGAHASAAKGPYHADAVQEWIQSKCGANGSPGLWAYEGALYDPMTGNQICNVEGMEIVTPLASCAKSNQDACQAFRSNCQSLAISRLLFPSNKDVATKTKSLNTSNDGSKEWDYATTLLSRKIFCYKMNDRLLEKIKVHQTAPTRQIPRSQAMVVWDAATTFVSRGKQGQELYVHTEQPNAACLSASTVATTTESSNRPSDAVSPATRLFDFTIYTKRKRGNKIGLPPLLSSSLNTNATMTASPPRSKLIQFGSGKKELLDKFGARETYSFSIPIQQEKQEEKNWLARFQQKGEARNQNAKASVSYTRFGEGPPWLGPGRMCTLELRGRRVDSIREAPPLLYETCFSNAKDLARFLPSFMPRRSVSARPTQKKPALNENQDLIISKEHNAVSLFREGTGSLMKEESNGGSFWKAWNRIRKATTSSSAGSSYSSSERNR